MDEEATDGGGRDHLAAPRWTTPYPSRRRIIQDDEESEEEQDEGQDKDHEEDHAPFLTRGGTADACSWSAVDHSVVLYPLSFIPIAKMKDGPILILRRMTLSLQSLFTWLTSE